MESPPLEDHPTVKWCSRSSLNWPERQLNLPKHCRLVLLAPPSLLQLSAAYKKSIWLQGKILLWNDTTSLLMPAYFIWKLAQTYKVFVHQSICLSMRLCGHDILGKDGAVYLWAMSKSSLLDLFWRGIFTHLSAPFHIYRCPRPLPLVTPCPSIVISPNISRTWHDTQVCIIFHG